MNEVKAGTSVRIKRLAASPDMTHRLRELGFCEEQQIKLVSRHSNLICQVCNARLGISPELAGTILVERLPAVSRGPELSGVGVPGGAVPGEISAVPGVS